MQKIIAAKDVMRLIGADPKKPPPVVYPDGVPHNVYRMLMGHLLAANQSSQIITDYIAPEKAPAQRTGQPPPQKRRAAIHDRALSASSDSEPGDGVPEPD